MRKQAKLILLFLSSIFGCSAQTPQNGLYVSCFKDTTLISEYGYYKDGKKDGTWRKYEITGKFKEVYNYKNGSKEGHYILFDVYGNPTKEGFIQNGFYTGVEYQYESGKVLRKLVYLLPFPVDAPAKPATKKVRETTYDLTSGIERMDGIMLNNKRDSVWKSFDDKGRLVAIENYRNGKRSGLCRRFSSGKRLAEMATFEDGYMEGIRLKMSEEGDTMEYAHYSGDKKHGYGMTVEYLAVKDLTDDQKNFIVQGTYDKGKLAGKFTLKYPSTKKIAAEEEYENGYLTGKRKLYYENGQPAYEAEYVKGKVAGKETKYYENGKKKVVSEYVEGALEGKQILFFESGKVSEEIVYDKGKLKSFTRYYENGKVREKILYEEGKVKKKEQFDEKGKKISLAEERNKNKEKLLKEINKLEKELKDLKKTSSSGGTTLKEGVDTTVYTYVEEMPEFPGGMQELIKYLTKNLKLPATAKDEIPPGKLNLSFVVKKDGQVDKAVALNNDCLICEEAAKSLSRDFPAFKPGKKNGTPVNVRMLLPVNIHWN
jgi:antitoxin component YwqK of YwqJK toxin-antitoxin module